MALLRSRVVGLAYSGGRYRRVGEGHPRAVLTDAQVDELRRLREEARWTLEALARRFGLTRQAASLICRYERRATTPERWHRVEALQASQEGA